MKETIKTVNLNRAMDIRGKVMQLTEFTEYELNLMMFDMAEEYCKHDLGMSEEWMSVWLREPLFWGWWKQQWMLVDEHYFAKFYVNAGKPELTNALRRRYRELHRNIDRFPDEVVYEKIHKHYEMTSHRMMQKIIAKHENL